MCYLSTRAILLWSYEYDIVIPWILWTIQINTTVFSFQYVVEYLNLLITLHMSYRGHRFSSYLSKYFLATYNSKFLLPTIARLYTYKVIYNFGFSLWVHPTVIDPGLSPPGSPGMFFLFVSDDMYILSYKLLYVFSLFNTHNLYRIEQLYMIC